MDLKKLNIIGTTKREDIDGDVPKDAQYGRLSTDKTFIQMFYKWKPVKLNDGSTQKLLYYFTSYGIWMPSDINQKNIVIDVIEILD